MDRVPSVSVRTRSVPRHNAMDHNATATSGGATASARRSNSRRAAADRARKFRSNSDRRDPSSRSNRHKARWASSSRPPAADVVAAAAAARGTTRHRSKAHRSSKTLASSVPKALRIQKVRVHLAGSVARARTVPAVPAVRARIGLHVRNEPRPVLIVQPLPSVPRQLIVLRLRKAPALQPTPRRASAAVSVVAVAAVVVVARAAVRRKANKRRPTLPDSAQPAMAPPEQPAHCADRD